MRSGKKDNQLIHRLIKENEILAIKSIGNTMYAVAVAYIIVAILMFIGFFKSNPIVPYALLGMAVVFVLIGYVSKKLVTKYSFIRDLQISMLILTSFCVNIAVGYKAWLLFALPLMLSCRYYDRKFTCRVGFMTVLFIVITAFVNTYLSYQIGFIDLNVVSFSEPGSIEYYSWLTNGVLKHGYETDLILRNSLRLQVLPNCLIIALLVLGCNIYIRDAERMLMVSYEAAEKEKEQAVLLYHSTHDELTGLFNRHAYVEKIKTLQEKECDIGVVFGDLNGLKVTNDTYGHEAGDKLLLRYVDVLSECFRKEDIYRISGDEFICIVENVSREELFLNVNKLESILKQEEPPLACVGACFGSGKDIEMLVKTAEAEMYAEKEIVHEKYPKTKR